MSFVTIEVQARGLKRVWYRLVVGYKISTRFEQGAVRGFLHRPPESAIGSVVLTHGAGSDCNASLLVAVADAISQAGLFVLRCDLPFRQRKRYGPPLPAMAEGDRAGLREAVRVIRDLHPVAMFLGGHSYGGRQASMLAAEDSTLVDGLLLLSYPLHPPRKPNQARTAHLSDLRNPALFIHGTRDPFGSIDEMTAAVALIPGAAKLVPVEGAGHDLARGKLAIQQIVAREFRSFFRPRLGD